MRAFLGFLVGAALASAGWWLYLDGWKRVDRPWFTKQNDEESLVIIGHAPKLPHPAQSFSGGRHFNSGNVSAYSFHNKDAYDRFCKLLHEYAESFWLSKPPAKKMPDPVE